MFSVVVREAQNDAEVVFEASQVRKHLYEGRKGTDDIIGEVRCETETGEIIYHISPSKPSDGSKDQTIFVMNRFGATVAKYHV